MIQLLEFLDRDFKMICIPLLHTFQKLEERLILLDRQMKDTNKTEMKTTLLDIENTLPDQTLPKKPLIYFKTLQQKLSRMKHAEKTLNKMNMEIYWDLSYVYKFIK